MIRATGEPRVFLFLQGPHGPFFARLGRMLRQTGAKVWRVGFNAGDRFFWPDRESFVAYRDDPADWPSHFAALCDEKGVTDLVLYGDVRAVHALALAEARKRGLRIHVFEEGYLRPYWVTYERDGSNGHSRLMTLSVEDMQRQLEGADSEAPLPPARWGDMRQHIFYGALYHGIVMARRRSFPAFRSHRKTPVQREFRFALRRLLRMPLTWAERGLRTRAVMRSGNPYHLALLQLEHDASFQSHSPFDTLPEFIDMVIEGFARGAAPHHHLVFKAHPLDDGRVDSRAAVAQAARRHGVAGRVVWLPGGKLGPLLGEARSAVTVNSTAAQQVLGRGIPLRAFGTAVFAKPEFVSTQPLEAFFQAPTRPDTRAYRAYRRYLLETSQIPGGYYSARGRRQLMRMVVDMMLAPHDPYTSFAQGTAAPRQQLRLGHG